MSALKPHWLPLAASLVLAGMGLQRWLADEPSHDRTSVTTSIAGDGLPTLVELGMNSCASCKAMHRALDESRAAHGERLRVISVNVMEQTELSSQWKIKAIPTQVLLDGDGRERDRHLGFLSAQAIRARFAALGLPLEMKGEDP
jgi:thioredoxin 1